LVAVATSLKPSEKGGQIGNLKSTIKHLPYGENLVKIGPADPEITLLKCLFKKEKKKLLQAEHIDRQGMHAARAKLSVCKYILLCPSS